MPWHEGWQLIVDEFQLWIFVPLPPTSRMPFTWSDLLTVLEL